MRCCYRAGKPYKTREMSSSATQLQMDAQRGIQCTIQHIQQYLTLPAVVWTWCDQTSRIMLGNNCLYFPCTLQTLVRWVFLPFFKESLNVKGRHSVGKNTSFRKIWGKMSFSNNYGAGLSYYGKAAPLDAGVREIKLLFTTTAGLLLLQALAHTAALWPAVGTEVCISKIRSSGLPTLV